MFIVIRMVYLLTNCLPNKNIKLRIDVIQYSMDLMLGMGYKDSNLDWFYLGRMKHEQDM